MTDDEIIQLAREAGFTESNCFSRLIVRHSNGSWVDVSRSVYRLVELAQAAQRKACARVADAVADTCLHPDEIAQAIREMDLVQDTDQQEGAVK